MFSEKNIIQESARSFRVGADCRDSVKAEELRAAFVGPVRQISMFADLYCEKNCLILEAADRDTLLRIVNVLNHSVDCF